MVLQLQQCGLSKNSMVDWRKVVGNYTISYIDLQIDSEVIEYAHKSNLKEKK